MLKLPFGLVLDFDGTVANTFEPSPSGVGVHEAYKYAVKDVLGEEAYQHYCKAGGLHNRAPREVVKDLFDAGFGIGIDLDITTEKLVECKIEYLLTEAFGQLCNDGTRWPRLTLGFEPFWREVKVRQQHITTVVLSSGHKECIIKTFEIHRLPQPDLIVTDDEFRKLPQPLCKPDARLWRYMLERVGDGFSEALYIGDDPAKDGGLARNAGVSFLHFAASGTMHFGKGGTFADWRDIIHQLK